jgi:pimeloyl-ACP methyl ester carboxylesterase
MTPTRGRIACTATGVLALALLVGCGATAPDGAAEGSSPVAPTPSVTTPASTPWVALGRKLGRCGPQPPRLATVHYRTTRLRDRGRVLPAITTGRGRTVVVLVHQTDGGGLCGWLDFAARIAEVPGQQALAFDLCGFGDSDCPDGSTTPRSQVQQVQLAIDAAGRLGARRIVVVGASMGGSLAVLTAAVDPRVDAVVDLSGPDDWRDAIVHRRAVDVRAPLLVAMAADEGPESVAAARATAQAAAHGVFVGADRGHGYELLVDASGAPTPVAARVLDWIAAR